MPVTVTIAAGNRDTLPEDRNTTKHAFATDSEIVAAIAKDGKNAKIAGFDSFEEFVDLARNAKRVKIQAPLRKGVSQGKAPRTNPFRD